MTYYDCHTYQAKTCADTVSILNWQRGTVMHTGQLYSVGIHPWAAEKENHTAALQQTEALAARPMVCAIGECGLDTLRGKDAQLQQKIFAAHVAIANNLHKPLIVHCVKAFEAALPILREARVPVIIHGINNKTEKVRPFIRCGYFLSFGKALLSGHSIACRTVMDIPAPQLLLETDDLDIPVSGIYRKAMEFRSIDADSFILQTEKNFKSIFII